MTLHNHEPMSWPITLSSAASLPADVSVVSLFQRYWLSDLKIMATAYGDHWEYSQIPSRTWANILAIASTSLKAGMICRASDLSLHTFIWDGTFWQSLNNALIKVGSSRTSVTLSGATSTTYQAAYTCSLPAKLLGSGGKLFADVKATFGSQSASQKRIGLMNGGMTVTIMAYDSTSASVAGFDGRLMGMFDTSSSVTRVAGATSTAGAPFISTNGGAISYDSTVALDISIVGLVANTAEAITILGFDLYAERRAA